MTRLLRTIFIAQKLHLRNPKCIFPLLLRSQQRKPAAVGACTETSTTAQLRSSDEDKGKGEGENSVGVLQLRALDREMVGAVPRVPNRWHNERVSWEQTHWHQVQWWVSSFRGSSGLMAPTTTPRVAPPQIGRDQPSIQLPAMENTFVSSFLFTFFKVKICHLGFVCFGSCGKL